MAAPEHRISTLIASLRARWLARRAAEGMVTGLGAGGVVLLGALALVVLGVGGSLRWLLLLLIGGALIGPGLVGGLRSWWMVRGAPAMAALVESRDPGLRTDVRTALEFLRRGEADADALRMSLRRRLIDRVRLRLENRQDEIAAALPRASLRWPVRLGTAAWVTVAALVVFVPDPWAGALRTLALGAPEATATGGEEAQIPLVETFTMRIRPPAYSGRPQRLLQGTSGDLQVLAGSEVALRTRALVPIDEARLVLGEGEAGRVTTLRVREDGTIEGEMTLLDPMPWWIEVRAAEGTWMRDPQPRRIAIEPDLAPVVEMITPSEDMQVGVEETVPVRYTASDDFGLRDVTLVWALDIEDARERRVPLHEALSTRGVEGESELDMATLRLQPRDVIRVHVEATDNDTVNGPKIGRSQAVRIRIAAPDELNEEVIVRLQELFEALLQQLGRMLPLQLVAWVPDESGSRLEARPAEADAVERADRASSAIEVGNRWPEVLELFSEVEERMGQDTFTPERDLDLVVATAARLRDAVAATQAFSGRIETRVRGGEVSPGEWAELSRLHGVELGRTESAILTLQDLIAEQQAAALERTLEELHASRDRLRELLQELRESDDPELRERIMDEIARLEERMRELMSRLRDQMENLPREHLNLDAMEPSEVSEQLEEMGSSLDRIRDLLEQGDIDGALDALDQMDSLLDQLQQEVGDPLSGAGSDGLDQFQEDMAEILEELTHLSELERQLEEETESILEEARQQRAEALQERMDSLFEDFGEALEEQIEGLESTDRDGFDGDLVQQMEDAEAALERLQQMVESRDVAGGAELAERAARAMRSLRMQSMMQGHSGTPDTRRRAEALRQQAERGADQLAEMGRQMQELRRQATPTPSPEGRQRMAELGGEQGQANERLDALRQRASQLAEEYGASPIEEETFEEVGRSMQRAERALREGRPEPALEGEREALQGLQQMRQQVQRMMQRRDQQRRAEQQGSGREISRERVEIPEDNLSDRRRFRDQVRDAMREGTMEAFEEEVRRYYESLVQ